MSNHEEARGIPVGLIGLLVTAHVAFAGGRFTLTLQAVALKASPLEIGLMLSLMMVLPTLLAIHAGRWSDQRGFVQPAGVGLTLLALGSVMAAFTTLVPALYAAGMLIGSGYMLAHVAINNAVGQATRAQALTRTFSALALGFSLSGMAGPLFAGFLIDHVGFAAAFGMGTVCTLGAGTLLAILLRAGVVKAHRREAGGRMHVADLLRHPPLRAVFIVTGLLSLGWDLFNFLAPLQGVRSGLTATATGMLIGAFGAGSFTTRLFLPLLMARTGEWRLLGTALMVTALCYLAFPLLHSLPLLLLAAFAMGLSLGAGQPVAMSLLHLKSPPARAGEAVGVRSTITSASQAILPMVFGALGASLGLLVMFWAAAAVLAAGGVFAGRHR